MKPLTPFFLTHYDKTKNMYHIIPFTLEDKQNCSTLNNKIICFSTAFESAHIYSVHHLNYKKVDKSASDVLTNNKTAYNIDAIIERFNIRGSLG